MVVAETHSYVLMVATFQTCLNLRVCGYKGKTMKSTKPEVQNTLCKALFTRMYSHILGGLWHGIGALITDSSAFNIARPFLFRKY